MANIVDSGLSTLNSVTSISLNQMLTVQSGDVLLVAHLWPGNSNSTVDPVGMSPITGITNPVQSGTASSDIRLGLHYTVITESSPSSWTWTIASARRQTLIWAVIRGLDSQNTINIAAASGPDTLTAPSVTTTVADTMLFYVGAHWDSSSSAQSFTAPVGMTEVIDTGAAQTYGVFAYQELTSSGMTGTKTATASQPSASFVAANIAFTLLHGNVRVWDGSTFSERKPKKIWSGSSWMD